MKGSRSTRRNVMFWMLAGVVLGAAGCSGSPGGGKVAPDGAFHDALEFLDVAVADGGADAFAGDNRILPGDARIFDVGAFDRGPREMGADGVFDAVPDGSNPDVAGVADRGTPDVGAPDAASPPPQCPATTACPAAPPSSYAASDGLRAIDACAFPMMDMNTWVTSGKIVDQIAKVAPRTSIAGVLSHLNRSGQSVSVSMLTGGTHPYVPGFVWAFGWNSGDQNVAYWIPQGLTGSPDSSSSGILGGKRVVLTAWYYDKSKDPNYAGEKGIRISFADATVPSKVTYRLLLLVEPTMNGTRADFKAIDIHAGGIAWVGRYLYVADTSRGLRVFDTGRILEVATTKNVLGYDSDTKKYYAYKYRYIVPQVGFYRQQSKCNPRFSFVALDRTSTPPALVSGEYASSSIAGRLFRWPVDLKTGKMPTGTFYPEKAYYLGKRQVQGAVSHGATTYLSSSQPPSGHGDLTGTTPGKRLFTDAWIDGSEDLVYDVTRGQLWGAGEARGKRYVFAVDAAKL